MYKDIWAAPIGAILHCERESFNPSDPYAVATSVVVGHMPQVISAACSVFIRGGVASCEVTGGRQYSVDLPLKVAWKFHVK